MKLPLSRIAEFVSASGSYDGNVIAQRYSIDSRTIQPGDLFFAVKGERLDGHDFVEQAFSKGAVAAVVRKTPNRRYRLDGQNYYKRGYRPCSFFAFPRAEI